jgi:probable addiction module antidote protein
MKNKPKAKVTMPKIKKPKAAKPKVTYAAFEIADFLDNETVIAEYLAAAAEDGNPELLIRALANVAKARGMAKVAKDAGLGRESLYKALRRGSKPRFDTVAAVMRALNVRIAVEAK